MNNHGLTILTTALDELLITEVVVDTAAPASDTVVVAIVPAAEKTEHPNKRLEKMLAMKRSMGVLRIW